MRYYSHIPEDTHGTKCHSLEQQKHFLSEINAQNTTWDNLPSLVIINKLKTVAVVAHVAQCIAINHNLSCVPIYTKIITAILHNYCEFQNTV